MYQPINLKENYEVSTYDSRVTLCKELGKDFLNKTLKTQNIKAKKFFNLIYVTIEDFCSMKNIMKKVINDRIGTDVLVKFKELISRKNQELVQINKKRTETSN